MKKILNILLLFLFCSASIFAQDKKDPGDSISETNINPHYLEELYLDSLNYYRKLNGRSPLQINSELSKYALEHSEYQDSLDVMVHSNLTCECRSKCAIYGYVETFGIIVSESLSAFLDSPLHYKILMQRDITKVGLGVAVSTSISETLFSPMEDHCYSLTIVCN